MNKIIKQINELNVFDKDINEIIINWVEKITFSILWSDYKTFNQNIDKTISYLDQWYSKDTLNTLKSETSLKSIILFISNSKKFQDSYWKWFEEIYRYLVKNNIELIEDSKLNRWFFKALSRLSFIDLNWNYIFPKLSYNKNYLENLNKKLDELAHYVKTEWAKANPNQWIKSNIIAWISNIWIKDENLKTFLSLLWEEQENMYEQKLWFLLWLLITKKHPLNVIIDTNFQKSIENIINSLNLKNNDYYENNLIKEPETEYNSNQSLPTNPKIMEKLTSQELLLLISLLTKPFSILYWVSWTWKSRVVKELWKKLYWEEYNKYFYKEAVPPNWFDESEIIWRYNKIEWYIEWNFIKKLEEAIKDPEHNYVYLLDEMNLSHIEQYFAQYLSAIEELNDDKWWLNIWKIESSNVNIKDIKNNIDIYKFNLNDDYEIKLSKRDGSWEKWDIFIKWELITETGELVVESIINPTDFYRKLMRYFIDNYEWIDKIFRKVDDWKYWEYATPNDYEEYKGYYYTMTLNTNDKIKEIKKIVNKLDSNLLDNIKYTFKREVEDNTMINWNNLIEYYDNQWNIVWKSLKIPKNLFVIWTINLDETTKSISPKVVDRANIIEFNDLDDFLFITDKNKYILDFLKDFEIPENYIESIKKRNEDNQNISKENKEFLQKIYEYLKLFKLHFSYRTLNEILIFMAIWKELWIEEDNLLDLAIMQKILPKLNGIIDSNFSLYDGDKHLTYNTDDNKYFKDFKELISEGIIDGNKFKNTALKLKRMQQFFDTYQNVNYFLS